MDRVEELYQEIHTLVKSEQYEAATHACDRLRLQGCVDDTVLRTKIYCLIQRKMWNQAINNIKTLEKDNIELPFEKSYCLYRTNNFKEALECLDLLGDPTKMLDKVDNRAICYLKIQVLYRLGRFEECDRLCSLIKPVLSEQGNAEELEMLEVNRLAVLSSSNDPNRLIDDLDIPEYLTDSIEYWFNRSSLYLSNNDLDNGLTALEMSESLLTSSLECEEQDKPYINTSDECSLILMRAYILQCVGNTEDAEALYEKSFRDFGLDGLKLEPSMVHLGVVAYNNHFLLSKNNNPYSYIDGLKRLSITAKDKIEHKLTINQNFLIALNKALLFYNENGVKHYIKEAEAYSTDNLKLELFRIGLFILQGKTKKAIQHMDVIHNKYPNKVEFSVSILNILLKLKIIALGMKVSEHIIENIETNIESWENSPHLFEEFVILLQKILSEKFPNSGFETIKQNIKLIFIKVKLGVDRRKPNDRISSIFCILGKHLLIWSLFVEAAECFRYVIEDLSDSNNERALSGYIISCTLGGLEINKAYLRQLDKNLPNSVFSIDAEVLEKMEPPTRNNLSAPQQFNPVNQSNPTKKTKKKCKRKPRFPKGFDPSNPGLAPDPERWLPKEERSSFKKLNKNRNNKKKNQPIKGGHQGEIPTSSLQTKEAPSTAKHAALLSGNVRRSHKKKKR
ncbi:signal recognition particle subunit SRP72-like [Cryptosporidium felis]|nr:signal recognition particle subunit SRP72-like [Cryptosporidium felis]